ncbi:MAG: ABC transporter permease subunit [Clostridia bacterium]|nr:ABC transporter permease subunit [Clostridia bacterium]
MKTLLRTCGVTAFWLCVWQLLALFVGNGLLLPSPVAVLVRLGQLALTAGFWKATGLSLLRVVLGSALAVLLGVLLAVICCRWKLADVLVSPLVTVIKSTPVASFIVLLLLWLGRDVLPMVIVLLMALPVIWGNVCAGIRSTDPLLLRTAKVFCFSPGRTLRRVYIPSVMPHFLSACRTALGLGWKAGIAAEVLTVPALSIGKLLMESKLYLEVSDLFAWTLTVILCSLLIEKVLMAAIGRFGKACIPGGEDA